METSILQKIQSELKCPKNQYNSFGKYNYRNAEDIQEALKPVLAKHGHSLTISDDIVMVGDRVYVKATVSLISASMDIVVTTTAFAREPLSRKGMDEAQVSGASSSYARKYALGGMFLLDDTKDADSMDRPTATPTKKDPSKKPAKPSPIQEMIGKFAKAKEVLNEKTGDDSIYYAALETMGAKHANDIKAVAEGDKLLAEFRTFLKPKEEKATFPPED